MLTGDTFIRYNLICEVINQTDKLPRSNRGDAIPLDAL